MVLKKYFLTPQNEQQVILLSKSKTTSWSAIHRLARKIDFKQSVVDQGKINCSKNNYG